MVDLMAQLFSVIGFDVIPPTNLYELFPYLLKVSIAFLIVSFIFNMVRGWTNKVVGGNLV